MGNCEERRKIECQSMMPLQANRQGPYPGRPLPAARGDVQKDEHTGLKTHPESYLKGYSHSVHQQNEAMERYLRYVHDVQSIFGEAREGQVLIHHPSQGWDQLHRKIDIHVCLCHNKDPGVIMHAMGNLSPWCGTKPV
jgi:hypothetical protein